MGISISILWMWKSLEIIQFYNGDFIMLDYRTGEIHYNQRRKYWKKLLNFQKKNINKEKNISSAFGIKICISMDFFLSFSAISMNNENKEIKKKLVLQRKFLSDDDDFVLNLLELFAKH